MLQDFLTTGVFAFLLTFVRVGAAVTIMPGLGDSFTPATIRLYIALALTLVLSPFVTPYLPHPVPQTAALLGLLGMEFVVGLLFGTIARVFMAALDTAGMLLSIQSGLGSAQLFNPAFATQGSLLGAFMSVTGVTFLFVTNFDHLLIYGLVGSYKVFPIGVVPDTGSMADMMARAVSGAFMVGLEISAPFIIVTLIGYIGMGIMARLMPQVQIFMLAVPVQIMVSLVIFAATVSAGLLYWMSQFQDAMTYFLGGGAAP